jgi:hypothetical protein
MEELIIGIVALTFLGGLIYFWYKSQMFAVSKLLFFLGILVAPIGAVIGIVWALQDLVIFRTIKTKKIKFNMRARYIVFNIFLAQTLILSTLVGLVGVEEYEGGYLWELMCILSPLLLGFQIRAIYEKFEIIEINEN